MEIKVYKEPYITMQGDTWDEISKAFYGTSHKTAQLIFLNMKYAATIVFDEGVKLIIPLLDIKNTTSLPPWKR